MFYIYFHINPIKNKVFYVGKGKGDRAYCTKDRNDYWRNTVNKYGYKTIIVRSNISERYAFELEKGYIKIFGLENLTNITEGGTGGDTISNHPNRDKIVKKISLANKGELNSNYGGATCTKEWRKKQSISQSKVPLKVFDTKTNEEFFFNNSKEVSDYFNTSRSNVRECKKQGYKLKKRYIITDA